MEGQPCFKSRLLNIGSQMKEKDAIEEKKKKNKDSWNFP